MSKRKASTTEPPHGPLPTSPHYLRQIAVGSDIRGSGLQSQQLQVRERRDGKVTVRIGEQKDEKLVFAAIELTRTQCTVLIEALAALLPPLSSKAGP